MESIQLIQPKQHSMENFKPNTLIFNFVRFLQVMMENFHYTFPLYPHPSTKEAAGRMMH